jgi:hypothetical protein
MQRIAVTARVAGGAAAAAGRPAGASAPAAAALSLVGVRPRGERGQEGRAAKGSCGRPAFAASAATWRQLPPSAPASRAMTAGASQEEKKPIEVTIEKVEKPDPHKVLRCAAHGRACSCARAVAVRVCFVQAVRGQRPWSARGVSLYTSVAQPVCVVP